MKVLILFVLWLSDLLSMKKGHMIFLRLITVNFLNFVHSNS